MAEHDRVGWLITDAAALRGCYDDPAGKPSLYGVPVGDKDIFHADGFPTSAGSEFLTAR